MRYPSPNETIAIDEYTCPNCGLVVKVPIPHKYEWRKRVENRKYNKSASIKCARCGVKFAERWVD